MQKEYSRILRFEFPVIPILGGLLLVLLVINVPSAAPIFLNEHGKPAVATIATCAFLLGTAGFAVSQLVSFSFFDIFFVLRALMKSNTTRIEDRGSDWFEAIKKDLTPKLRKNPRREGHDERNRKSLGDLSASQVHSTMHALEINCRHKYPEIASQIEYFYSIYVIFSVFGLIALIFPVIGFSNFLLVSSGRSEFWVLETPMKVFLLDVIIFALCLLASMRARRFKERLRIKLLNSCRKDVIKLLSAWFQVELPEIDDTTSVNAREA